MPLVFTRCFLYLKLTIVLFTLALTSCAASLSRTLDRVALGMDKDQVLDLVGNPKRTHRLVGQDEWTYVYYEGEAETARSIYFEKGRVVKIANHEPRLPNSIEQADSLQEYEEAARALQKQQTQGFKELSGEHKEEDK